jgi:hypothetical protein
MALEVLALNQLSDADGEAALAKLLPLPDNVVIALRNLQAQVDALDARVDALEAP